MKRRNFLGVAGAAGLAPAALANGMNQGGRMQQEIIELRKYYLLNRSRQRRFDDFLENAAIPALNRAGAGPVGVFTPRYGENYPGLTYYIIASFKSMDVFLNLTSRLIDDYEFMSKGDAYISAPFADPAFVRYESALMRAFAYMPKIEVPKKKSTVYEMRTYESHSEKAALKKIEMFNEGGEIAIFKETGLNPVFFGETLCGRQMPNLTYMLAFSDMKERDAAWDVFRQAPAWERLSKDPQYADTVSNITDVILAPTPYSQI